MTIAPMNYPLASVEPMKVARRVMDGLWKAERGVPGLVVWRGQFWEWAKVGRVERWRRLERVQVEDRVRLGLEDAWVGSDEKVRRWGVNSGKVKEVVEALETLGRQAVEGHTELPAWLGGSECPVDRERTLAFEDGLLDVGTPTSVGRGREWFDGVVLPGTLEAEEGRGSPSCPVWWECLGKWGKGDPAWMGLAKRMVGMCLLPGKHHHRWGLLFGAAGTGKTTFMKVVEWLVGRDAYLSTDAASVGGGFGLDGMQGARLVGIKEVVDLEGKQGDAVAGVAKRIMGEDEVTINAKFERPEKNVKPKATLVMVSNTMPKLPNRGLGLSQKMLVLPFLEVFRGQEGEDLRLEEKLRGEIEGIARWALEGAREIEMAGPRERWPVPEEGREVVRRFVLDNNPADAFLEARCVRVEGGFVSNELLWREWEEWRAVNRIKVEVSRNRLGLFLCEEGTWGLTRTRKANGGPRGLRGVGLSKHADDAM